MVLFMTPETCKELGLALAVGEHAPASPHVPTLFQIAMHPTDPESKVSKCLGLTWFHSILLSLSEKATIKLLLKVAYSALLVIPYQ